MSQSEILSSFILVDIAFVKTNKRINTSVICVENMRTENSFVVDKLQHTRERYLDWEWLLEWSIAVIPNCRRWLFIDSSLAIPQHSEHTGTLFHFLLCFFNRFHYTRLIDSFFLTSKVHAKQLISSSSLVYSRYRRQMLYKLEILYSAENVS